MSSEFNNEKINLKVTDPAYAPLFNDCFNQILDNTTFLNDTKSNKLDILNITLEAKKWQGEQAPFFYTHEGAFEKFSTYEQIILSKPYTLTETQREAIKDAEIDIHNITDTEIVIRADGYKPPIDLPIIIGGR